MSATPPLPHLPAVEWDEGPKAVLSARAERACFAGALVAFIVGVICAFSPAPRLRDTNPPGHGDTMLSLLVHSGIGFILLGGLLLLAGFIFRVWRRAIEARLAYLKMMQAEAALAAGMPPAAAFDPTSRERAAVSNSAVSSKSEPATRLAALALVPAPMVWLLGYGGIRSWVLLAAIPAGLVLALVSSWRATDPATRKLAWAGIVLNAVAVLFVFAGMLAAVWLRGTVTRP